jgi:hypothetical protein
MFHLPNYWTIFVEIWYFEVCYKRPFPNLVLCQLHALFVGRVAQSVYRLATGLMVRGSNPGGGRFSAPVQTGPGAHLASCTRGTGSFPGVESGRGVTLTPQPLLVPRSKTRGELYLYSPKGLRALFAYCETSGPAQFFIKQHIAQYLLGNIKYRIVKSSPVKNISPVRCICHVPLVDFR